MSDDVRARNLRNKRTGAAWERALLDGMRSERYDIERLRLAGAKDEGDHVIRLDTGLWVPPSVVVTEAKAGVMHAAEFVRQATTEADNYAARRKLDRSKVLAIAAVKARGKNWRDAYVLTTVRELFRLEG